MLHESPSNVSLGTKKQELNWHIDRQTSRMRASETILLCRIYNMPTQLAKQDNMQTGAYTIVGQSGLLPTQVWQNGRHHRETRRITIQLPTQFQVAIYARDAGVFGRSVNPGGADYAHHITTGSPDFWTVRRHCALENYITQFHEYCDRYYLDF